MTEASEGIAHWLEQKRRTDRISAAVISVLALGSGAAVFLLTTLLIYAVLSVACGSLGHSVHGLWFAAFVLTAGFFARSMKGWRDDPDLGLDPMGFWVIKDICLVGPRL